MGGALYRRAAFLPADFSGVEASALTTLAARAKSDGRYQDILGDVMTEMGVKSVPIPPGMVSYMQRRTAAFIELAALYQTKPTALFLLGAGFSLLAEDIEGLKRVVLVDLSEQVSRREAVIIDPVSDEFDFDVLGASVTDSAEVNRFSEFVIAQRNVLVIMEGLFFYLTPAQQKRLLADLDAAFSDKRLTIIFDAISSFSRWCSPSEKAEITQGPLSSLAEVEALISSESTLVLKEMRSLVPGFLQCLGYPFSPLYYAASMVVLGRNAVTK